jgi:hypothetical protein
VAGRPWHRHRLPEGQGDQAAHRGAALSYERKPRALTEGVEDRLEKRASMHGRPEVAHPRGEDLIEVIKELSATDLDREA